MKNIKKESIETENRVVQQLNYIFRGASYERNPNSGQYWPGDVQFSTSSPLWAKHWLQEHQIEIKKEQKPRLGAYVKQCIDQFNSTQNWVILYVCPEDWGIPGNLVAILPALPYLLEQKSVIDSRSIGGI